MPFIQTKSKLAFSHSKMQIKFDPSINKLNKRSIMPSSAVGIAIFGGTQSNINLRLCNICKKELLKELQNCNLISFKTSHIEILLCVEGIGIRCKDLALNHVEVLQVLDEFFTGAKAKILLKSRCYGILNFGHTKLGYASYEKELGPVLKLRLYNQSRAELMNELNNPIS